MAIINLARGAVQPRAPAICVVRTNAVWATLHLGSADQNGGLNDVDTIQFVGAGFGCVAVRYGVRRSTSARHLGHVGSILLDSSAGVPSRDIARCFRRVRTCPISTNKPVMDKTPARNNHSARAAPMNSFGMRILPRVCVHPMKKCVPRHRKMTTSHLIAKRGASCKTNT